MTNVIAFTIPGKPFPKERPRFSRGKVHTPKATVQFEKMVGELASLYVREPLAGPVRVSVTAIFKPAPSWSKKKTQKHLGKPHTQTPDADNLMKAILDGLNGVAFIDDAQVADQQCRKLWGEEAKTIVTIQEIAVVEFRGEIT